MKRDFISISGLKKVLSPKELKNITGGSYTFCEEWFNKFSVCTGVCSFYDDHGGYHSGYCGVTYLSGWSDCRCFA